MLRITESHHVSGKLNHHVLVAATGAERGNIVLPSKPNGVQCPAQVTVGTPRCQPQCVEVFQGCDVGLH